MKHNSLSLNIKLLICFLGFLSVFCYSCSEQKQDEEKSDTCQFFTIDAEKAFKNPEPFLLSAIADTIIYVPLETRQDMMLGRIHQIILRDSIIYIRHDDRVVMFSITGEALGMVGRIGRGPGEYTHAMGFSVEKKTGKILIQGEYRYVFYDALGNFLGDIIPKIKGSNKFVLYRPDRMAFYFATNDSDKNPVNLIITDSLMNEVASFTNLNPTSVNRGFFLSHTPMYMFENTLHIKEHYNDTVYKVVNDLMVPKYAVKETAFLIPFDFSLVGPGSLMEKVEKVKDKFLGRNILETQRYVFLTYIKGLPSGIETGFLYDKMSGKTYYLADDFIKNDLDGGMGFWPMAVKGESYLVGYRWAHEIKAHVASRDFKDATNIDPAYKARLQQLANNLKNTDNPVLMFVKLKGQ